MRHALLVLLLVLACGGPEPAPEPGACADKPAICLASLPDLGDRPFTVSEAALCDKLVEIVGRVERLEERCP